MKRVVLSAAVLGAWIAVATPLQAVEATAVVQSVQLAQAVPSRTARPRYDPLAPPQPPAAIDPFAKEEERLRRLLNPETRLKLDPNPSANLPPEAAPPTAPSFPTGVERLDRNRDGAISRSEYFRGRDQLIPAGPGADFRQRLQMERLNSRFRDADRNRDGIVSPQELESYGNPRF